MPRPNNRKKEHPKMKTRTTTDPRNIPVNPGAMTQAELTRRTLANIAQAVAVVITAAAFAVLFAVLS